MGITTERFEYQGHDHSFEGYLARPEGGPAPVVLVCHAWGGLGAFEKQKAEALAGLGYAGFAIDVYGVGKRGTTTEENQRLMTPLVENRAELQARLRVGVEHAKRLPGVDTGKRAAIGFCFGGLCVLDMARAGMDVSGVASFHGLFGQPANIDSPKISAKVVAYHGWDDPMAKPEDAVGFAKEMSEAGADWQLHAYGHTLHAFTNPDANNPDFGTVYSPDADHRSWEALKIFLKEVLG